MVSYGWYGCYFIVSLLYFINTFLKLLILAPNLWSLFVFAYVMVDLVQTDPNWSNFLYDEATKLINLIDFGAARDYPKSFVDDYLGMVSSLYSTLALLFVLKSLSVLIFSCMSLY